MNTPAVGAIVLAGGASRRMGTQKLLLPFGESTILETIVETLLAVPVAGVVVVTGHSHDGIVERLAGRDVTFARNESFDEGMLSSVRVGLRAAPPEWEGYVIALGDQPTLRVETVRALFDAKGRGATIAVPVHAGRRGHPLYVQRTYRDAILTQFDDEGLRGLLRGFPEAVVEIPVDSAGIHVDVDRPEDYKRLLQEKR